METQTPLTDNNTPMPADNATTASADSSSQPRLTILSPLEMNDIHFNRLHTVITPELLARMSSVGKAG